MQGMECFIIVTVLWVFSVCLHEFGHAWAADRGGDYTVREKGYLNMNPLRYAHPVYSLLMPVLFMMMGGIGLPGGAVYINRQLLRSKGWETWVSLAGLAMNLVLIILISALFRFGLVQNDPGNLASISLGFLLQLELGAFVLNLLPIPPLDGFQAIAPWLPTEHSESLYAISNQALFILFIVMWYVKPVNIAFWGVVNWLTALAGVSPYVAYSGWEAFRFWAH
jgi:Zn-dependent protease